MMNGRKILPVFRSSFIVPRSSLRHGRRPAAPIDREQERSGRESDNLSFLRSRTQAMMTPPETPTRGRGPDWWLFLTKFFRHGTAIGAVAPSSSWLARKLVHDIDFSQPSCIVELGA